MNLPFERNNYFWGKLLSAEDFTAEQRYFDEKRRFLNRIIHGGGVLCGLETLKLDEKRILVQSGAALDFAGREIVLPDPVAKNISLIDGFSYDDKDGFAYLCVSFRENFRDEAPAVETGAEKQFGRIWEEARLYFTKEEPAYPSDAQSMDEILDDSFRVYLAKVYFVMGASSFVIEKVEDLRRKIIGQTEEALPAPDFSDAFRGIEAKIEKVLKEYIQLSQMRPTVSSGIAVIDFGLQTKRNRVFYSPQIVHGLGAGHVSITLGVINDDTDSLAAGKELAYYGAQGIFNESFAVAAKVYITAGVFVIGVRIMNDVSVTQVKVHWTAVRDNAFTPGVKAEPFMTITPSTANISRREHFTFRLEGFGIDKASVIWSVPDVDGGAISKNGEYYAPNKAGVYEIQAAAEKHTASAFVVVK